MSTTRLSWNSEMHTASCPRLRLQSSLSMGGSPSYMQLLGCQCTSSELCLIVADKDLDFGPSSMYKTVVIYVSFSRSVWECTFQLTKPSACAELYHCNPCVSHCRATNDLGLLWSVLLVPSSRDIAHSGDTHRLFKFPRKQCYRENYDDNCRYTQCWPQLVLLLPPPDCLHGLWRCEA